MEKATSQEESHPMKIRRFLCSKKPPAYVWEGHPQYSAAGCAFTDGFLVLAGYQPNKKRPGISGLGGNREGKEFYHTTAFRETLEEIFGITPVSFPPDLISTLRNKLPPRRILNKDGYITLLYNFKDLETFLKICKTQRLRSPLFPDGIPTNLTDLIFNRIYDTETEVRTLCLLPVIRTTGSPILKEFLQDMADF